MNGASGSFYSSGSNYNIGEVRLIVRWSQTYTPGVGQSIITVNAELQRQYDTTSGAGGTWYAWSTGGVSVDGTEVCGWRDRATLASLTNPGQVGWSGSGSVTVAHTEAKDITISIDKITWQNITYSASSVTIPAKTVTVTLDAIPMASTISATAANLGDPVVITITKAKSDMLDTITWQCGTQSGTIVERSADTSFSWTPPVSLASQSPDTSTVSITLTTNTYDGTTASGSNSISVSCGIPSSVVPSCDFSVDDGAGYKPTYGGYVQGQSTAHITVTSAGAYGSTITATKIICGESVGYGSDLTFGLASSGTINIAVEVTDSRNRIYSTSKTITVLPYSPPSIVISNIFRSDVTGQDDSDGAYGTAEISATITPLNNLNSASYAVLYKARGTTTWSRIELTAYSNVYSLADVHQTFAAAESSVFEVYAEATDAFSTTQSTYRTLRAAFKLMDFDRDNRAIGVGRTAATADTAMFGVAVNMGANKISDLGAPTDDTDAATKKYVDENSGGASFDEIYPVGSIYLSANSTSPASLFGGTWEQLKDTFLLAAGDSYTAGDMGGETEHTLTVDEMPSHDHYIGLLNTASNYLPNGSKAVRSLRFKSSTYTPYINGVATDTPSTDISDDTFIQTSGGGAAHNNMPPYLTVYMWQRVG